jgi:hypothetical protein
MTVRELIAVLSQFSPDSRVVVRGYEAGYDDPEVRPARAMFDWTDGGGVYGRHAAEDDVVAPLDQWTAVVCVDRP